MDEPIDRSEGEPPLREMKARDVIDVITRLTEAGIEVVVDGGWGVDALLGHQIRLHEDLDIAVEHRHVARLREVLGADGYTETARDDTRDCNFVLADRQGHEIDVHSYTFDGEGKPVYGVAYPKDSLSGTGSVDGLPVRCISAEWMVRFHTGYPLDENDFKDVSALSQRFGIEIPEGYDELRK
ncbi:MAG: nucleotidyltransferase domain-containing protein [Fimbriimonadales bacterium]